MSHLTNDFDSEMIEVLNSAIQDALREVQNGGGPMTRPAYARITRAVIAKRVTEMAKKGERDRHKLSEYGVRSIILNHREEARRAPAEQTRKAPAAGSDEGDRGPSTGAISEKTACACAKHGA
jgi:hypothetical protein